MSRSRWPRLAATLGTFALAAWSAGCASTGAVPHPFPVPGGTRPVSPATATPETGSLAAPLVASALALRGTPYRNGGSDPTGFDCSGFTQYVFAENGIALPREVRDQFEIGRPVDTLAPGDLIFFTTTAPGPTHVGIAIGGDEFVHAPSSNGVVRVEHLGAPYWARRYLGARRVEPTQ